MAILLNPDPATEARTRALAARGEVSAAVDLLRPCLERAVRPAAVVATPPAGVDADDFDAQLTRLQEEVARSLGRDPPVVIDAASAPVAGPPDGDLDGPAKAAAWERLFAEADAELDRTLGPDREPLPEAAFDRASMYDDLRRAGLGSDGDPPEQP